MRLGILFIIVITAFAFAACRFIKSKARTPNSVTNQATPVASPPGLNEFKDLLFADQSLEEFAASFKIDSAPANDDFSRFFALALSASRKGNINEAKQNLRKILAIPNVEARVKLWTWKALRQFGETPPPDMSREVHGVIIEMPVEGGLDTLAVYSDGTMRYINYSGKIFIWEAPDNRFDSLTKEILKSAEPLVNKTPALDKRQAAQQGFAQVSILTFGGIHQAEDKDAEMNENSALHPTIMAGGKLVYALAEMQEANKSKESH